MSRRPRFYPVIATFVALSLTACDLLEVDYPGTILEEDLEGPEALDPVYAGALYDLARAWSEAVWSTGLLADEFLASHPALFFHAIDRRNVDEQLDIDVYLNTHRVRVSAEAAADRVEQHSEDPEDPRLPELLAIAGFAYVSLADVYCDGVPLSSVAPDGSLKYGLPTTGRQLREAALMRFERALATPAASGTAGHFARVAYAQALLGLGRLDDAAAAIASVPTDYAYRIGHTEEGIGNGVYDLNWRSEAITVADSEGGNGLPFRSRLDPRVPWVRSPPNNVGFDRETPLYGLLKYSSREDPIAIATGVEARLIEAEAALANADPQWLVILQDLRAASGLDFTGVPVLLDQGSIDANVDLVFEERAFWLFGTGRRLADLRRLVRQYGRLPDDVFPTGSHPDGGLYGSSTFFQVPFAERSNPNFTGCLAP